MINFVFSLKMTIPKELAYSPESYTNDITVNLSQKGTKMFIAVIRKTCPGLYENILNSYKALSFKNEWSLLFSDDLVIFSHFNVSRVDPGAEFPRGAVAGGGGGGGRKSHKRIQETAVT